MELEPEPRKSPFNLKTCARPNILALEPYRCAREYATLHSLCDSMLTKSSDYENNGINILLDANENAFGPTLSSGFHGLASNGTQSPSLDLLGLNRYPDPHQRPLKQLLCNLRNTHVHTTETITPANLYLGVGSDEAIDALMRTFCTPGRDKILVCPPTYGMYNVSAQSNDVDLVKIPLLPAPTFDLNIPAISTALSEDPTIKLVYACTPGNPTGSLLPKEQIQALLEHPTWNGVVVLDEAYIDLAPEGSSMAEWVAEWPNLVVMQTLSKAFGLAGIRLGVAFCAPEVALLLNSLKAPYNISSPTSALATQALEDGGLKVMRSNREKIISQRSRLLQEMPNIDGIGRFRGGDASNFLLVELLNEEGDPDNAIALGVYESLAETRGVVVRFRGKEHGCLGCLRITVGTAAENDRFLADLPVVIKEVWEEVSKGEHVGAIEKKKEEAANNVVA
jgi:histidinol-phosphate aminotransferase